MEHTFFDAIFEPNSNILGIFLACTIPMAVVVGTLKIKITWSELLISILLGCILSYTGAIIFNETMARPSYPNNQVQRFLFIYVLGDLGGLWSYFTVKFLFQFVWVYPIVRYIFKLDGKKSLLISAILLLNIAVYCWFTIAFGIFSLSPL